MYGSFFGLRFEPGTMFWPGPTETKNPPMVTRPVPQGAGGLFFNAGNYLSPVQCGRNGKQIKISKPPESIMSSSPFLERAIALYGSAARLAERVGVTEAAISQARKRGQCSVKLAAAIVRDSNGVIDANVSELTDAK
jgi:hypothetical protein